ncbi:MAG: LysM peptidoglycan-binding domain-containing protein [Aequorivita sp.]
MPNIYRTYKVKPQDTLSSIAQAYNLDLEELKAYHNKRAPIQDEVLLRLPQYLKEIILPPEGFILKDGKEIWANKDEAEPEVLKEEFHGKLQFTAPLNDIAYGVLKTIKNGKKESTIKYKLSLRFYPKDADNDRFVSVDKISKTFINDEEPSLMADEMALACTDVLYPILFEIDSNGRLLNIHNHSEILKRWKNKRSNELQYFQGEVAENYFDLFEKSLEEKEYLFHKLQSDWFFIGYFNDIYSVYDNQTNIEKEIGFPILPHTKGVAYVIDQRAENFSVNNRIKIFLKGKCSDLRSKTELESKIYFPSIEAEEKNTVDGDFKGSYFLDPKDNSIQFAYIFCNLELSEQKSMAITISKINVTDEDEVARHPKTIMEREETEKKTFWKSIFS